MRSEGRCFLYRFFGAEDSLLYVGISSDIGSRFSGHRRGSEWWGSIVRCEVEAFADRASAEAAESIAISTEGPRFNRMQPSVARCVQRRGAGPDALALAGEVESLRRQAGEDYVHIARLEIANAALQRRLEEVTARLKWALSDVRETDGVLAQAVARARLAEAQVRASVA